MVDSPNSYTMLNYPKSGDVESTRQVLRQHKDSMHRYTDIDLQEEKDHYLRADDGKLDLLRVQQTPNHERPSIDRFAITWSPPRKINSFRRVWRGFRNAPRAIIRWTYNDGEKSEDDTSRSTLVFKYPVACLALALTIFTGALEGEVFFGGRYLPVRYEYFCYPKYARNKYENNNAIPRSQRVDEPDLEDLVAIGKASAIEANLQAFWIDVLCLDDKEGKQDSHRISDIARGCDRMVIAVKDEAEARYTRQPSAPLDSLLQNWASRLWTVPELLLAPTKHDFAIYHASAGLTPIEIIPKRNMAERAYNNGNLIRQLVDHFESSVHLTQIELLTIGLECLLSRQFKNYYPADLIYALMTLVRRRPIPRRDQTIFEAFAQLSLLNDSNMLLERLLCVLPPNRGTDWTHIEDFWGCKLWDIVPSIQVAAITPNDSVLIDGAFGASIEWEALRSVAFLKRHSIMSTFVHGVMRTAPFFFLSGCITLGFSSLMSTTTTMLAGNYGYDIVEPSSNINQRVVGIGAAFLSIGLLLIAALPVWVRSLYRGKFWGTQAHLFGLEGVANIEWLEQQLFGLCEGRLKWATNGSTQSRHRPKIIGEHLMDECEATTPSLDELPREQNEDPPDHLFTLVDTYTMTAMVFRAVHPPSVALVCGQEGGMRRALLCSYNHESQTFHRETVVRMPTKVLDRMDRVNKFRFSMASMPLEDVRK